MAETPRPRLNFDADGNGWREVTLPAAPLVLGDDFAWRARDFDTIRLAMLEELAARFPERRDWAAADLEVVLAEVLAAALDQLHDMADRVAAEATLETARRPSSVRRLLAFIGHDAALEAGLGPGALEALWTAEPARMAEARLEGPRRVHRQRRMVTPGDAVTRLQEHPLVVRAAADSAWNGSWTALRAAVVLPWANARLDEPWRSAAAGFDLDRIAADIVEFHRRHALPLPDLAAAATTPRAILTACLEAWRLAGQPVHLADPVPVGIAIDLALTLRPDYFQSEVRRAVADALGTQAGGLFEPGRLGFGEDLHLGDLYQWLLGLEGVAQLTVRRFQRLGEQGPMLPADNRIALGGLELAVCDNRPTRPGRGHFTLALGGGGADEHTCSAVFVGRCDGSPPCTQGRAVTTLPGPNDLTRWNRAGLRRVHYVDGGAADHLERLRAALALAFPDWAAVQALVPEAGQPGSDAATQRRRLLEQYAATSRDPVWELMRAFARATHVLGGHIDAFANEATLETATQWDLLRRLVAMLGYAPAPPASATTPLVLIAKALPPGMVRAGLAVRHSPVDGQPPVVFETLTDLGVDAALNALRPARCNRSEARFFPFAASGAIGSAAAAATAGLSARLTAEAATVAPGWRAEAKMRLSVGQPAVLVQAADTTLGVAGAVVTTGIAALDDELGTLALADGGAAAPARGWRRGYTRLLTGPARVLTPRLNGPRVLRTRAPHGLVAGDVVAWRDNGTWCFARVLAATDAALRVDGTPPPVGSAIHRAARVPPVSDASSQTLEYRVPLAASVEIALAADDGAGALRVLDLAKALSPHQARNGEPDYRVLAPGQPTPLALWLLASGAPAVATTMADEGLDGYCVVAGAPVGLGSGDWLVAELRAEPQAALQQQAARVLRVEAGDGEFALWLAFDGAPLQGTLGSSTPVQRDLITQLRRVEGILDHGYFVATTLAQVLQGALAALPVSAVIGVGPLHAQPASHADRLSRLGVHTVADLAALPAGTAVPGLSAQRLRVLQARAQHLTSLPAELPSATAALGGQTLAALIGAGGTATPAKARSARIIERLHGPLRHTLYPAGHDRNPLPLPLRDRPKLDQLVLPPGTPPALLQPGRLLVIEQDDAETVPPVAHQTTLKALRTLPGAGGIELTLADPLPADAGFTLGNTVIRGNAVRAGHGESRPPRMLGSGNAALLNQSFVLDLSGIASVPDPTLRAGVRPDVAVYVDGQAWTAVESLGDSGPADPHFTLRMIEDGGLRIGFGDGRHGRRLPTGTNNVVARCRVGVGLGGNLPAGALRQLARPDRLVQTVRQPLPALGGNDLESVDDIRVNAPASVRTLERAVSLADYAHLATSQSSVWQAAARRAPPRGGLERVQVTVVPANGAPLDRQRRPQVAPDFLAAQRDFLQRRAPEGVLVSVRAYEPVLVDLDLRVAIDPARWDRATVLARVEAAVLAAFGLRRRRLGQPLQLGELYKVVEDVTGVAYSTCTLALSAAPAGGSTPRPQSVQPLDPEDAGSGLLSVQPGPGQVVVLDAQHSRLVVVAEEVTT